MKIRRNIQEALKKIGGQIVFDDNFNKASSIVLTKDDKETWIERNEMALRGQLFFSQTSSRVKL